MRRETSRMNEFLSKMLIGEAFSKPIFSYKFFLNYETTFLILCCQLRLVYNIFIVKANYVVHVNVFLLNLKNTIEDNLNLFFKIINFSADIFDHSDIVYIIANVVPKKSILLYEIYYLYLQLSLELIIVFH